MTAKSLHKCRWLGVSACAIAQLSAMAADSPFGRGLPFSTGTTIDGRWNGANIERRSNCTASQNNGDHGTYAQFQVSTDTASLGITQSGVTGLNCNYFGNYHVIGNSRSADGTYSCTDGKHGSFRTRSILASNEALSIRMDITLDGTETCTIDSIIGAARLP